MGLFRFAMIVVLVLCVLPWGAYSGARAATWQAELATERAQATAGDRQAVAPDRSARLQHAEIRRPGKTCRVATLPGSTCGPDLALAAALDRPQVMARWAVLRPDPGRAGSGIEPPGILDPPRRL